MSMKKLAILAALLCLALAFGLSFQALAEEPPLTLTIERETVSFAGEPGDTDNDTLLDAYVQRMIDASLNQPVYNRRVSPIGASLTGVDKVVYDILKNEVSKIAAGTRTSTVINITVQNLDDKGIDVGPWTARDLGVSAIVVNGEIAQDAIEAASAKVNATERVMKALQYDCPCELYWYDKRDGYSYGGFGLSCTHNGREYVLYPDDSIEFVLDVSQDYAGGTTYTVRFNNGTSKTYQVSVNSSKVEAAAAAIKNAQDIVEASASAGGSVYSRLAGYKDAICDRVSYNDAASGGGSSYGDPWQLIYVFDGNTKTNVVCEGYSKAFKYLFDLSGFGGDYDCILVTGSMSGGSGAGLHMWNLVQMENEENYLVDVTNCDSGTIGSPDKLFMASGPSGSWNNYSFRIGTRQIAYAYDADTIAAFPQSALTVSDASYTPAFGTASFTLPADTGAIAASAFEGDTSITVVDASHCTSIGASAFKGCTGLMRIRLPKNCAIASSAFANCGTVYVFAPSGGTTQTACASIGNLSFVAEKAGA